MATIASRGSGTPVTSGTTWASTANAVDGAVGSNPATYTTYTNATSGAVGYIEISGHNFAATIGASDTVTSVAIVVRESVNNTGRFASIQYQPYDGTTALGTLRTGSLSTSAHDDTATEVALTTAQVRSANFKIRVTVNGAASTQSRIFSLDHVDVTVTYTPATPAITQAAYRFYDQGTESGSTALQAQDTAHTGDLTFGDGIGQLRLRLQSTTAVAVAATDDFNLQYEKNASGTWINVTTGNAVIGYNDPSLTEGAATTSRLTGGSGSFVAGKVSEDGVADNVGWTANNYTELLFSCQFVKAQMADGDVIRFRVLRNGATTGMTYSATPTVNIYVPVTHDMAASGTGTSDGAVALRLTNSVSAAGTGTSDGSAAIAISSPPGGGFTLVANVKGGANDTFTTTAIDTSGADLLVACYASNSGAGALSDSKSNTWTLAASQTTQWGSYIYYADAAIVGASHTFTMTGTDGFHNLQVYAFSGSDTSADPLEDNNGGLLFGATSIQPGSVSPSTDGQLIVSHCGHAVESGATINSSFTSPAGAGTGYGDPNSAGVFAGAHSAYLIQTTAGAVNPTWTVGSSTNMYATIVTFKAATVAGPFVPTDFTDLAVWLDASDASTFTYSSSTVVSAWNDKSGNGNHFTQGTVGNQPNRNGTQNGLTTVTFDFQDGLSRSVVSTATDNFTIVVAYKHRGERAGGDGDLLYFNGDPGSGGYGPAAIVQDVARTGFLRGALAWHQSTTNNTAAPCVMTLIRDGGTWGHYLDGVSTSASGSTSAPNTPASTSQVASTNSAHSFMGEIYEIIHYEQALDTTDRETVETYLTEKWFTPVVSITDPTDIANCSLWLDAADASTFTLTNAPGDDWTGTNGNPWSAAKWEDVLATSSGVVDIQSNQGRMSSAGAAYASCRARLVMSNQADVDVRVKFALSSTTEQYVIVGVRTSTSWCGGSLQAEPADGYTVEFYSSSGGELFLRKYTGGSKSTLGSSSTPTDNTAAQWVRIQAVGTTIRCKWWLDSGAEPGTWDITATDATNTTGRVSLSHYNGATGSTQTVTYDDLTLISSVVSEWRDKSTSGFDFVPTFLSTAYAPSRTGTLNGLSTVVCDGTDSMVQADAPINNATNGSFTVFAVALCDNPGTVPQIIDGDDGGSIRVAQYLRFNGTEIESITFNTGGSPSFAIGGSITVSTPHVFASRCTGTATEVFVDGTSVGSSTQSNQRYSVNAKLAICSGTNENTGRLDGEIAEIVAYSRDLTDIECDEVTTYLTEKWFVAGGPTSHAITASGTGTSTGTAAITLVSGAVSHAITASGTGTLDGAAALRLTMRATASGTGTSDGTAEIRRLLYFTGSGTGQTDGAVALRLTMRTTASGTDISDGAVEIRRVMPLTASGTGTSDGSAAISLAGALGITASGTGAFGGAAAVTARLTVTASGAATLDGTATLRRLMPLTGSGTGVSDGTATIGRKVPMTASGAVTFDGIATLRQVMPFTGSGTGTFTGAVGLGIPKSMTASGTTATFTGSAAIAISQGAVNHQLIGNGFSQMDGSATLVQRLAVSGSGIGTSTGSVDIRRRMPLTASGAAALDGAAALRLIQTVTASGTGVTDGTVIIGRRHSITALGTGTFDGTVTLRQRFAISAMGLNLFAGTVEIRIPGERIGIDIAITVGALTADTKYIFGEMTASPPVIVGGLTQGAVVNDFAPVALVAATRIDDRVIVADWGGSASIADMEATPPVTVGGFRPGAEVEELREDK